MLDSEAFKTLVKNAPLVSIDLCLIYQNKLLLGKRNNEPLKGEWFTPGGRIHKNETWAQALTRIVKSELNIAHVDVGAYSLMGIWDHFYNNSAFDPNISTHYVNLPHYAELHTKPEIISDEQHVAFAWLDLLMVSKHQNYHPYMRKYASWLLNEKRKKND